MSQGLIFIKAGLLTYFSHSIIVLETVYHTFGIYLSYFSNALSIDFIIDFYVLFFCQTKIWYILTIQKSIISVLLHCKSDNNPVTHKYNLFRYLLCENNLLILKQIQHYFQHNQHFRP